MSGIDVTFDHWLAHFRANPARQREAEAKVEWDVPATVDKRARRAFVRSFQRFELGERGDGERLLAKASATGDPTYLAALELLVLEEQKHSALFRRGLDHHRAGLGQRNCCRSGRTVIDPDPASKSGRTARIIGYSPSADMVITIIVLEEGRVT